MFALLRLIGVGFVVLTIIYIALSLYSRSVRKGKLRAEWREQALAGVAEQSEEAFVDIGMIEYDNSLRRKLILGVYVVPTVLVGAIIYLTNFA
jgi:hypothetical protein